MWNFYPKSNALHTLLSEWLFLRFPVLIFLQIRTQYASVRTENSYFCSPSTSVGPVEFLLYGVHCVAKERTWRISSFHHSAQSDESFVIIPVKNTRARRLHILCKYLRSSAKRKESSCDCRSHWSTFQNDCLTVRWLRTT